MQKYQNNVTDSVGNAVAGLPITVSLVGGGLATIYSDDGVTTAPNPLTTDAFGHFEFYAADGRYDIAATGGGYTDVQIADFLGISASAAAAAQAVIDVGQAQIDISVQAAADSAAEAAATLVDRPTRDELAVSGVAETIGSAAFNPGSGKPLGMLGAAVRYDGAIGLINDTGHLPAGITTIEAVDDYTFRVNFDHGFSKVGTLLASMDNDLAPYGIQVGASVGVSSATFVMYAPLIFTAQGDGTILNIAPFWEDVVSLNTAGSTSVIFNKPAGLNTNGPQVTPLTSGVPSLLSTSWGSTTITVASVAMPSVGGGHVVYTGGAFVLSNSNVTGLSVAASTNTCVITHPALGTSATRMVVSADSPLRPDIKTRSSTTTTVQFRKPDGSVATVATDGADMNFDFSFGGLTPLSSLAATAKFTVDCGLCRVKLAQLGKVALNNLWLTGFMNKG